MGLSVVHGIVEKMAGHIDISSAIGVGTEITISFPAISETSYLTDYDTDISLSITKGEEHILLVDDEEPVLQMTKKYLQKEGYTVTAEADPFNALKIFKNSQTSIDLVISDVSMPGMTGDELAVKILKINPKLPIILCTGYSENVTRDYIQQLGIKTLINKPIMPKELARMIRHILDKEKPPVKNSV